MHRLKSDRNQNAFGRQRNKKLKTKEPSKKIVVNKKMQQTAESQDSETTFPNTFENNFGSCKESKNFNDFPDEIILRVFSFLPKLRLKSLCTKVCKRWNKLSDDSYLWKKVLYGKEMIEVADVEEIITRGVDQLDLSKSMLENYVPLFQTGFKKVFSIKRFSKLQYLYLDDSAYPLPEYEFRHTFSKLTADILSVCSCLKFLKLRKIWLNATILHHISMNKKMRELYWISCLFYLDRGSEYFNFRDMCENCQKLNIVDFSDTYLKVEGIIMLCKYLPLSVKSLTLCTLNRKKVILQNNVKGIIKRCPNIEHLKIGYSGHLNYNTLILIINSLPMLKTFDISCFGSNTLPIEYLFLFRRSPNLAELILAQNSYSLLDIIDLKYVLKNVKISLTELSVV